MTVPANRTDAARADATDQPPLPDQRDVYLARARVMPYVRRTPLIPSPALSALAGASVHLKLENLQRTGAFKVRGAANKLLSLSDDERGRGVVTASSGNHGLALAYVAGRLGIRATVVVSKRVPPAKTGRIAALGAELVVHGSSYDEAEVYSRVLARELGLTRIYPDDDPFIMAGQGTIGLELLEDLPEIDTVVVPVGGGGLISGIATALTAADQAIQVVGVSMARAPVMIESLKAGQPVGMAELQTLADGLAGGIGLDNRYTFRACRALVDQTFVVTEDQIAVAMARMFHEHHLVVEGAGAVGIAALLAGIVVPLGRHVTIIVSGGNVDAAVLARIHRRWLEGRYRPAHSSG
jgi:threonine dehydratase